MSLQTLINLILPPRCLKCGKILGEHNGLCGECFQNITFISEPLCDCCGRPFASEARLISGHKHLCGECLKQKRKIFTKQRSAFVYDDFSKSLIVDFKFFDKTSYAETLANMLYACGRDIWAENPDLIIPVPIHKMRLLKRKYNQSALLAHYLSKKSGITESCTNLVRLKNSVPQVSLTRYKRLTNLSGAFAVKNPDEIAGKNIVLIDDVYTTGATLKECAKALKKAKAGKIYTLTLARTEL